MFNFIRKIITVMSPEQKKNFLVLQVFVILMAVVEVMSIAAIGPFMALVGNINLIESNTLFNQFYVKMGFGSSEDFLFFVGIVVLILLSVSAFLSILTIWRLSYFAATVGAEFGDTLYEYYIRKDFLFHANTSSSQLTKQIATEVARVTDHVLQPLVQINARIVVSILLSVAIFLYNPVIALVGLFLIIGIYYFIFVMVRSKLAQNGSAISKVAKERFRLMNEGFGAIKDVQLLGCEDMFIAKFKDSGAIFAEAYGSSNGLYNMPRYLMELIIYSGMIGLILVLLKIYEGDLADILPVLAVFGVAVFKLLPSFQQMYTGAAQIRSNISALDALTTDLSQARLLSKVKINIPDRESEIDGFIELKDIYFKYSNKPYNALDGVSLKFPVKTSIALVGSSGSGKSTLIDVFLGLIIPDKGELIVGGETIAKENLRSWQNRVGYVPQSIFLTEGSVVDNVAFGVERNFIDLKKVKRAIKMAHLEDWVCKLPDTYLTKIGERGVQISGGQRQRLGIARALYNDADFIFFDEATSALDGITEKLIMEAIEDLGKDKTIVIIAHRVNTVKNCDLIYVMDQGNVVDQGTYEYLINNNKFFQQIALIK